MRIPTDTELIRSVQSGNISAYETVIHRYQRPLLAYVARMSGNRQDAEDIVQETFVSVYRTLGNIDPSGKLAPYLFTAAHNKTVSFLRKRKTTVPLQEGDWTEDDTFLYEKLYSEETAGEVRGKMDALEEKFRRALESYYFDGKSYEEIGHEMGIPLNTVKTYVFRGKERLRRMYDKDA